MSTNVQETGWLERVDNLFMRFGIKSITMDDVASNLGISKKTLYQMVESKDELVHKVLSHHITREKSQCMVWSSESKNAIEEILSVMKANSQEISQMKANVLNDLQKYHRDSWLMVRNFHFDFVFKIIKANVTRGRGEGLYREDFDMDIIAKLHLANGFNLFDEQLFPFDAIPRATLFNEFMMHYLHGIVSPKGLSYLKKKLS
ncbi:MAG: TetR/AcrR family transcriptional regulator [Bacteroidota bacterium]|nr:TetR/AcrR family transcriptional regulator [Bacteroidota bacterium]